MTVLSPSDTGRGEQSQRRGHLHCSGATWHDTPPLRSAAKLSLLCAINSQNKEKLKHARFSPVQIRSLGHDQCAPYASEGNLASDEKNTENAA